MLHEVEMTTPFDWIDTLTYNGSVSLPSGNGLPGDGGYSENGNHFLIIDTGDDGIYQLNLNN